MKMKCLICSEETKKYKCSKCIQYCCSFNCYKAHTVGKCIAPHAQNETIQTDDVEDKLKKSILQFTTQDTVSSDKLAELANSESLKKLLKNKHLRDFLMEVDTAENAWKTMRSAMLEPLFIEFADECLKIVEPSET